MGLSLLTKICLLVLLISASFISTSSAGRCGSRFVTARLMEETGATDSIQDINTEEKEEREEIHERLLTVNTKDYGRYDPAPALVKPPFKLIPN